MNAKRVLLESEVAKLMMIQLVEVDSNGRILNNVTENDFDAYDKALITAAASQVDGQQVVMLQHAGPQQRRGFCFRTETETILCGIGFPGMDELQLKLCALCLYIGLLGRTPISKAVKVSTKIVEKTPVMFHSLVQAVAKGNWQVLRNIIQERLTKVIPTRQRLVGLSLMTGLFFGRQLTAGHQLQHFATDVSNWWERLRGDQTAEIDIAHQLMQVFDEAAHNGSRIRGDHLVNAVIADVEAHLESRLPVSDVAKRTQLSADYINRHFKAKTGWTLKQYILKRKINLAKQLLMTNSVADVCYTLHFSDQSHFARVFRQQAGITPHAFKRQIQSVQQD